MPLIENHKSISEWAKFVAESNRIEGIRRPPTDAEMNELYRFLELKVITIAELKKFVAVYQPDAVLRDKTGMNVRVGKYLPPAGAPAIRKKLQAILDDIGWETPYNIHCQYESLHPFTDGNGRSGRMLWLWMMQGMAPLGFLHTWYYQSLDGMRK